MNTFGMMHFWGLTINVVTTVLLIFAMGLSVDYSAHIGYGFMVPDDVAKTKNGKHTCMHAHAQYWSWPLDWQ